MYRYSVCSVTFNVLFFKCKWSSHQLCWLAIVYIYKRFATSSFLGMVKQCNIAAKHLWWLTYSVLFAIAHFMVERLQKYLFECTHAYKVKLAILIPLHYPSWITGKLHIYVCQSRNCTVLLWMVLFFYKTEHVASSGGVYKTYCEDCTLIDPGYCMIHDILNGTPFDLKLITSASSCTKLIQVHSNMYIIFE